MEYYKNYVSNTLAGTSGQYIFKAEDENKVQKGRIFYKIFCGGKYDYSFLFSNMTDSTFREDVSCNQPCGEWELISAHVGICTSYGDNSAEDTKTPYALTFLGETKKLVQPCEMFCSDPVTLDGKSGEYICIEIEFKGKEFVYHPEIQIDSFVLDGDNWVKSPMIPNPCMMGCSRKPKARIGFLGDSITQGIGVTPNSYMHYTALLADKLGTDYSFWNLGIGCGQARDAATDNVWLNKAKQNDIVFVCFGVNDINHDQSAEEIEKSLYTIVTLLKKQGIKVILQTVPPFDYEGDHAKTYREVNQFIMNDMPKIADAVFDNTKVLRVSEEQATIAKYGGHPNEEGCQKWAEALYSAVSDKLC